MLHVFKALGAMIAMDVDSGSVHMVDEPAYEVLSRIETMEPDAIVAELKDRFDENDLREIIAEIDEMKQAGQLLTNYDYTGLEIKTAGTVERRCVCTRRTIATCAASTVLRTAATITANTGCYCPTTWA